MTDEVAHFCPDCGSPAVEASVLVGGDAKCGSCPWMGKTTDLMTYRFSHDLGDKDQVLELFVREVINVFVKGLTMQLGKLLVKWGFLVLNKPETTQHLRIYLGRAASAVAVSFLETRKMIATGEISKEAIYDLSKGVEEVEARIHGN